MTSPAAATRAGGAWRRSWSSRRATGVWAAGSGARRCPGAIDRWCASRPLRSRCACGLPDPARRGRRRPARALRSVAGAPDRGAACAALQRWSRPDRAGRRAAGGAGRIPAEGPPDLGPPGGDRGARQRSARAGEGIVRRGAGRAVQRLRGALQRRRLPRPGRPQLRGRRALPRGGPRLSQGASPRRGGAGPRRRHLLPGAVAALEPRLRRAGRQRRDQPLRPGPVGSHPLVAWRPSRARSRFGCSPGRGRPTRCAASPPPPAASRAAGAAGSTARGSRPASRT